MKTALKRQKLPVLYVVATPIGNLGDLSKRAANTLKSVGRIYAEDTRQARKILNVIEARGRVVRLDAHCSEKKVRTFLERHAADGKDFALVTDAGTPSVSDPGSMLVRLAREANFTVSAVPGPSAVTSFVSVAGSKSSKFSFRGFFPKKTSERKKEISEVLRLPQGELRIWYESPRRVLKTLEYIESELGSSRKAFVSKEMTKLNERHWAGDLGEVVESVRAADLRGEWCLGVETVGEGTKTREDWRVHAKEMLKSGLSSRDAARQVSQVFGINRKEVYRWLNQQEDKKSFSKT